LTFESLWWPIGSQIEVLKIAFQSNSLLVHYISNACIKIKALKPQLIDVLNIAKQKNTDFVAELHGTTHNEMY
jgi:hypothetical protein